MSTLMTGLPLPADFVLGSEAPFSIAVMRVSNALTCAWMPTTSLDTVEISSESPLMSVTRPPTATLFSKAVLSVLNCHSLFA